MNAFTAATFKNHIIATHPNIINDELPPDHTLMVEAFMTKKKKKLSKKQNKI